MLQRLKKRLATEQESAARHSAEIAMLRETVTRLTAAAQGSEDRNISWAQLVRDNHRLQDDISRLVRQHSDMHSSLRAENMQLSKMVYSEFSPYVL